MINIIKSCTLTIKPSLEMRKDDDETIGIDDAEIRKSTRCFGHFLRSFTFPIDACARHTHIYKLLYNLLAHIVHTLLWHYKHTGGTSNEKWKNKSQIVCLSKHSIVKVDLNK